MNAQKRSMKSVADVRQSPESACHLAKSAFDQAVVCLDEYTCSSSAKDSIMILQLLKDDLESWSREFQGKRQIVTNGIDTDGVVHRQVSVTWLLENRLLHLSHYRLLYCCTIIRCYPYVINLSRH